MDYGLPHYAAPTGRMGSSRPSLRVHLAAKGPTPPSGAQSTTLGRSKATASGRDGPLVRAQACMSRTDGRMQETRNTEILRPLKVHGGPGARHGRIIFPPHPPNHQQISNGHCQRSFILGVQHAVSFGLAGTIRSPLSPFVHLHCAVGFSALTLCYWNSC